MGVSNLMRRTRMSQMKRFLPVKTVGAEQKKRVFKRSFRIAHLPTQVVCRQWLKEKYSFVRSANHEMQSPSQKSVIELLADHDFSKKNLIHFFALQRLG